jgi:hypothetical protein
MPAGTPLPLVLVALLACLAMLLPAASAHVVTLLATSGLLLTFLSAFLLLLAILVALLLLAIAVFVFSFVVHDCLLFARDVMRLRNRTAATGKGSRP